VGLIVVDAAVVVAFLDGRDAFHPAAVEEIRNARRRFEPLILPAVAYAECLVAPSRAGEGRVEAFNELLESVLWVEPISVEIAARAAAIRARGADRGGLRDAFVLATAEILRADRLLTTRRGWPRSRIPVRRLRPCPKLPSTAPQARAGQRADDHRRRGGGLPTIETD
jgi:predicted nucleic acid-binding protein